MSWKIRTTMATTSRMCNRPPAVNEVTRLASHKTGKTTTLV